MGGTAEKSTVTALPSGSFIALPPETPHYVFIEDETVIQITTNGPWDLKYVNPADDPSKSQ